MRGLCIVFAAASLFAARTAAAQDADDFWPASQYGIELSAGGGVESFSHQQMRNETSPAGLWDLRAVVGTRSPIAVEGAYTGTAQRIDAVIGNQTGTLVGTGLSGDLRVNLMPMEMVTPYAFGGLGWKRYDVTNANFTTADTGVASSDDLLEIPLGGGLSLRDRGVTADARFTYSVATGQNLVINNNGDQPVSTDRGSANMDNWSVSARIGTEF